MFKVRTAKEALISCVVLIVVIVTLIVGLHRYINTWTILTDGECYTFSKGSFVDQTCYATEEKARAKMKSLQEHYYGKEEFNNRTFVPVEDFYNK